MTEPQQPQADKPDTIGGPVGTPPEGYQPPTSAPLATEGTAGKSEAEVGQDLLDAGGGATGVSQAQLDQLMAQMAKMQQQLDQQAALQGAATKDDVHKYALALRDHLAVKGSMAGSLAAQDEHGVPLDLADQLVAAADGTAEAAGDDVDIPGTVEKIHRWVTRHLRRNPGDYEYIRELLDELADAHDQTSGK